MSWIGQIAATGMEAQGQLLQGQEQAQADNYNAQLADVQASEAATQGKITQFQMAEAETNLRSTQESQYAKAGVMLSGSALDVMLQSATDFEFDRSVERYNTAIKVQNYQSQATLDRYKAKTDERNAKFNAGLTILQGAVKVAKGIEGTATTVATAGAV